VSATIGFGAGGHAKVVLDALGGADRRILGLLDPDVRLHGTSCLGVPILGGDDLVASLVAQGATDFFVGVGSAGSTALRQRLYRLGVSHGLVPMSVVHRAAIVSTHASLGPGTVVLAGAVVNTAASLGANVIVNTAAVVEHDCVIGDHAHVASGATVLGSVVIGAGAHIGGGATIRQGVSVGADAVVGAGAVVVADVPPGETVVGVPARPFHKQRAERE
jgi:sugar O-acyltransferase (sialic acid O-acetyltransferase NeuD family)